MTETIVRHGQNTSWLSVCFLGLRRAIVSITTALLSNTVASKVVYACGSLLCLFADVRICENQCHCMLASDTPILAHPPSMIKCCLGLGMGTGLHGADTCLHIADISLHGADISLHGANISLRSADIVVTNCFPYVRMESSLYIYNKNCHPAWTLYKLISA